MDRVGFLVTREDEQHIGLLDTGFRHQHGCRQCHRQPRATQELCCFRNYHLPPQNIEAEQAILARCLLNHTEDVFDLLTPDDFYRTAHSKIFSIILDLIHKKQPVDLISVSNALRDKGQLEDIGGAAYLSILTDQTPMAPNIPHYAKILREKALLRRIIEISSNTYQACHETNQTHQPHL